MNSRILLVIAAIILVIGGLSVFTVSETEHAVRFRFGEIRNSDYEPGLHFKLPWENVLKIDKRVLTVDRPPSEFLTEEKEKVFVDFLVKWKIVNPDQYYRSTRGVESVAAARLVPIIEAGLMDEFAARQINDLVSVERSEVMRTIADQAGNAAKQFGAEIVDVRLRRIDLSEDVSETVFNRMKQERNRVAAERRAEGEGAATRVRAEADKQRTVILANAYRESQEIRGEGDAQSAKIYAEAFEQDPEFYSFFRSLQAYRRSLGSGRDVLLLDKDNEFFKYLNPPAAK